MSFLNLSEEFEVLLKEVFCKFNFEVETQVIIGNNPIIEVDLLIKKNKSPTLVELKFYRDDRVGIGNLNNAVQKLFDKLFIFSVEKTSGLLIVSSYVTSQFKNITKTKYGILVWDRSDIYNIIKKRLRDDLLLERFEKLLLNAKQGVDVEDVFDKVIQNDQIGEESLDLFNFPTIEDAVIKTQTEGQVLCSELNEIPIGREGWRKYEIKCIEILKYIFEDDLSNWDEQNTTDDELSRFDMVCRISSNSSFWSSLIQSFQSRFVLFEFKNYEKPIGQDQIYTTERYLYLRGLRSVAFIISRVGGKLQAVKAAKGALKEHGKLILILDNNDLCKMLQMKDSGDNPNDYLSDILDKFLISLSR